VSCSGVELGLSLGMGLYAWIGLMCGYGSKGLGLRV